MPYPTVNAPYGLRPVHLVGGQPFAGSVRHIPIVSGYTSNIFYGDAVRISSAGDIERISDGAADAPIGVFLGCSYTDATLGFVNRQYWPANQVSANAVALVCDDPDTLFKVAVVSTGTTMGTLSRAECINLNFQLEVNSGVTATGNSTMALDNSTGATTATLPLRVIDVVKETVDPVSGEFTEVIVKLNSHRYDNATGVA
jgi:hypothetical protein